MLSAADCTGTSELISFVTEMESCQDACLGMKPIESMRCLRRVLKAAKTGSGEVVQAIEACTFPLTERGFTMLIVTCRRSGKWKKAVEIFEAMNTPVVSSKGVFPNFYTYSSLISVCCNAGAWPRAMLVFREMKEAAREQLELSPDAEVYSSLVCALQRGKRMKDAVSVAAEAQEQCLVIDLDGVVAVVSALIELGRVEEALQWADELHGRDGILPAKLYTKILWECANCRDLSTCVEVFLMMQMVGVAPEEASCHEVIRAAAVAKDLGSCTDLLEEMKEGGINVKKETYECYLAALKI